MNFIPAELQDGGNSLVMQNGQSFALPEGHFETSKAATTVTLGIRSEDIVPEGHGARPKLPYHLDAEIKFSEPLGGETHLALEIGGQECIAKMLNPRTVQPGEVIPINVNLHNIHLFDETTGLSLRKPLL